jgi:hypothetical protein
MRMLSVQFGVKIRFACSCNAMLVGGLVIGICCWYGGLGSGESTTKEMNSGGSVLVRGHVST